MHPLFCFTLIHEKNIQVLVNARDTELPTLVVVFAMLFLLLALGEPIYDYGKKWFGQHTHPAIDTEVSAS